MEDLFMDENLTVEEVTPADIEMQKLYIERDRVKAISNAATYMFFIYILVGLIGILKSFFSVQEFLLLLVMAIAILLIASYPYTRSLKKEQIFLNKIEKKLDNKKIKIKKRHIKRKK
ncbi:MAG: hypothetical protein ACQER9_00725 [Nanobdellota archaeon]